MEKLNAKAKAKAIIYAILFQLIIAAIVFFGGILDPLLGIIATGINFFVVNTYFVYRFFLEKTRK